MEKRLKKLRNGILKVTKDSHGSNFAYSLPSIRDICTSHGCIDEYSRLLALLGDTEKIGPISAKGATKTHRVIASWVTGLEWSSERCQIQKKHVANLAQLSSKNIGMFSSLGITQSEKTLRRDTFTAVMTYKLKLNEHLKKKLYCDGIYKHPRALISWEDDFTRAYAERMFLPVKKTAASR